MPSNGELDVLVAEKVFGIETEWRLCEYNDDTGYQEIQEDLKNHSQDWIDKCYPKKLWTKDESLRPCYLEDNKWKVVPSYCLDIGDAWSVIERMEKLGFECTIKYMRNVSGSGNETFTNVDFWSPCDGRRGTTSDEYASFAVCNAAITAIDAKPTV